MGTPQRWISSFHQLEVAPGVLLLAKHRVGHGAGGIVHRQEQGEVGTSVPQPGMMAAVNLHQHAFAWGILCRRTRCRGGRRFRGLGMPALVRMRCTVRRLRSIPSRSRSSSARWV